MSPRDFNHLQQHFLSQDSTSTKINNLSKLHPSSPKGIMHRSLLGRSQSRFHYVLSLFVEKELHI